MTSKRTALYLGLGLLAALLVTSHSTAFAQSTIFNIPSTDVVAPKKPNIGWQWVNRNDP